MTGRSRLVWFACVACAIGSVPVDGQQLLDRVVARVNRVAITLTDVRAALALGVVTPPAGVDPHAGATDLLIDRQLVLAEVERFTPPEPSAPAMAIETAELIDAAGPGLPDLLASTGLTQARLQEIARNNLRIRAYLDQRFGVTVQLTEDEVTQYYRIRPDEFTRDGRLAPFAEVESLVRERAGAERRAMLVAQWVRDLRVRAEIDVPVPR